LTQFAEVTGQRERLDEFVTDANIKYHRRMMAEHRKMIERLLKEEQAKLRVGLRPCRSQASHRGKGSCRESMVATHYSIGEPIWYRQVAQNDIQVAGVVADISVGDPTVTYCIRLENKDRVWADFSQLVPRYR
jgi:hypothetical protein